MLLPKEFSSFCLDLLSAMWLEAGSVHFYLFKDTLIKLKYNSKIDKWGNEYDMFSIH